MYYSNGDTLLVRLYNAGHAIEFVTFFMLVKDNLETPRFIRNNDPRLELSGRLLAKRKYTFDEIRTRGFVVSVDR